MAITTKNYKVGDTIEPLVYINIKDVCKDDTSNWTGTCNVYAIETEDFIPYDKPNVIESFILVSDISDTQTPFDDLYKELKKLHSYMNAQENM